MKLTLDDRQQMCAAYLADEKVRHIAKRFGVTRPCVAYHVRHLPRRKSVGTCSKIYQLKRMAERQNRLMALKQGNAVNAVRALVVKQIAAKNTHLRSACDIHEALRKHSFDVILDGMAMAAMNEANLPCADQVIVLPGKFHGGRWLPN
jgi:hypothetical protein